MRNLLFFKDIWWKPCLFVFTTLHVPWLVSNPHTHPSRILSQAY
jgi:hypothetical protein